MSLVDGALSQWSSGVQHPTWHPGVPPFQALFPASLFIIILPWLLLEPDLSLFLFFLQVPEENINGVVNALQVSQAEKH